MGGCCAFNCTNSSTKGFLMHKFPSDKKIRKVWEMKVSRRGWSPTTGSLLCTAHFKDSDYECKRADNRKFLKKGAVPSKFSHKPLKSAPPQRSHRCGPIVQQETMAPVADPVMRSHDHDYSRPSSSAPSPDPHPDPESLPEMVEMRENVGQQLEDTKFQLRQQQALVKQYQRQLHNVNEIFNTNQMAALARNSTRGFKWQDETVKDGLQLKFACGTTGYEAILEKGLPYPSIRTLQRRLQDIPFHPGILNEVFAFMKIKIDHMKPEERMCCLTLDEMSIKKAIEFDPSLGTIVGQSNLPGSQGIANSACVFMLGGVTSRWKQVVAYYYSAKKAEGGYLADIILELLNKAHAIGLSVVAVTSDMGPYNQAMWKKFGIVSNINNVKVSIPHPVAENSDLFFLADVPHLVKNLKQQWIKDTQVFFSAEIVEGNSLPSNHADISHIRDLLNFQIHKDLKLAPQLTDTILDPSQFDKMKVSHALHLFSRSVSAGLKYLHQRERRSESYLTTAWFVDLVNRWFDLACSRSISVALSHTNAEAHAGAVAHLRQTLSVLATMSFAGSKGWKAVQRGMTLSTTSILRLSENILPAQLYLLTSRFSQDCLENLFSSVRSRGPTPSAREFRSHLKLITISQYLKSSEKGSYNVDDREYLAEFLSTSPPDNTEADSTDDSDVLAIDVVEADLSEDEEASLYYLVGYCIRSLRRTKQLGCETCYKTTITDSPPSDVGGLTLLKEYREGVLCHPSQKSYEACRVAENVVRAAKDTMVGQAQIMDKLTSVALEQLPTQHPITCHNYRDLLVKKFTNVRVKLMCRKLTQSLIQRERREVELASKSMAMRALAKKVGRNKTK